MPWCGTRPKDGSARVSDMFDSRLSREIARREKWSAENDGHDDERRHIFEVAESLSRVQPESIDCAEDASRPGEGCSRRGACERQERYVQKTACSIDRQPAARHDARP